MRRLGTVLLLVITTAIGIGAVAAPQAHASVQSDFISSLVAPAQANERATGIPASVTIGMAALETGWGRSSMAKPPMNTLFNIKCTATKSKFQQGCSEVASYEYDSKGNRYLAVSGFRTYANTGDSLQDFGLFLTTLSRYRKAFDHTDDADAFVREVHRGGYATDPRYTELVVGIMKSYNLYQYNVGGKSQAAPLPILQGEYAPQTYGNTSTNITTLQRLLNARMGRSIALTGYYGVATQDAVADWQYEEAKFEEQSGEMDRATWESLVPTLKEGDRGPLVEALQKELEYSGYTITVDGIFGASTRAAVEDFQRRHSLPVTGTAATLTWGRMLGS